MQTGLELIDRLISCWNGWDSHEDYYLTVLAPSIVRLGGIAQLTPTERGIVSALRRLLSEEEWSRLPELIAQRRAKHLTALASDHERAAAREEAERREMEEQAKRRQDEQRKQRELEQERQRQEEVKRRHAEERERRQAEEAKLARKRALVARLQDSFESDFLSADRMFAHVPDAELSTDAEYEALKTEFVQDWAQRQLHLTLDPEQAAAVAATEGDVQVVARAGSGKTRTLVTRALLLQKHCGVSPRELLQLAFNKEAADETKSRLREALGENLPHVMTFHALAYALVHPEQDLVFDDVSADQFGLSREVQEVIDEHIRSREYGPLIRTLMLAHFREDWERIVAGQFQLTMSEFLEYRRALPRES